MKCDYCKRERETRPIHVQTNPQTREICRECWNKMAIEMTVNPMVGGGYLDGGWVRGIEITCHLCGHLWTYTGKSTARYLNCYQCGGKVKNPNFKSPKERRE